MDLDDPAKVRILGIDPGTSELGVTILELDVQYRSLRVAYCRAIGVRNNDVGSAMWLNMHDPQLLRINYLMGKVSELLWSVHPHFIACESPFMYSNPSAFEALVRIQTALYNTIWNYNTAGSMSLISPNEAKQAVGGVLGKAASKDNIRECVLSLPIEWAADIDKYSLTSDAIDSVTVAMCVARRILSNGLWA